MFTSEICCLFLFLPSNLTHIFATPFFEKTPEHCFHKSDSPYMSYNLFFLVVYNTVLSILGLFNFHISFRINISISKKLHLSYDWNYIRSFDQFGQNCYLNINFLIYEISVFLSLFSSLIFSQYLVGFSIDVMFLLNLFLNSVFYATYKWIFKFTTNCL